MATGATSAVLTVQQLSARAARIMRSTPWGRLMRPDVRLPHVQAFTGFLEASHRSLLQSIGIPSSAIFHSYTYLMNSFAAQLTTAEARRLKRHPAVAEVERDRTVRVTSVHSPEFLKLDSSLWPANGGQSNAGEGVIIGVIDSGIWPEHPSFSDPVSSPSDCVGVGYGFESAWQSNAGEGVIIGVIDSGIWPEHPSFSNPDPNGVPYSAAPVRWRGVCTKTDDFTACNGKVVGARGARVMLDMGEMGGMRQTLDSATGDAGVVVYNGRPGLGHSLNEAGSRQGASMSVPKIGAAGNAGVEVTTGGRTFGTASGMAPRARLAVYKALWIIGEYQGIGSGSDLIAAAEKAVADGVDVISCSWGGLAMYFQDLPYLRGLKPCHFSPSHSHPFSPSHFDLPMSPSSSHPPFLTLPFSPSLSHLPIVNLAFTPSSSHPPILTLPILTLPILTLPILTLPILTLPILTLTILTLPILTLPILTLPILTLPILTLPILTLPILTLPILTLPILTLPILTLPILTLPILTLPILTLPILTLPILTLPILTLPILTLHPHPSHPHPSHPHPSHPHPSHPHLSRFQAGVAGVVTAFAAGNEGRPNPMSIWGTLSNASPFYLTVGARYGWSGGGAEGGGVSEMTQNTASNNGRPNPMSIWGTLSSASPFYLTVGASTIGRNTIGRKYTAEFTLGDGTTFTGYSLGGTTATASPLPLMLAGSAASPPEATGAASTCDPEYVDATKVAGKFLVCIVTEWVHREWSYDAVLMWADTLGAAAILVISEAAEYDAVPIFSYSKTPSIVPTATLSAFTVSHSSNAPQLAYFSSTGPPRSPLYPPALLMRDFPTNDILKPDVIGPGYQLWAAAPGKSLETAATDPPEFNYYSGTSMSTPHLAGIMALIVQNKPSWSPSQVISAITTTAYTRNENGQLIQRANGKKANAWDYGGGHVDPTRVLDPGLTSPILP
ncbi:unnamed protein product [Closterium sp. NIES-64]|nr:unnamed protein product [Closterium sp. NIES-64]